MEAPFVFTRLRRDNRTTVLAGEIGVPHAEDFIYDGFLDNQPRKPSDLRLS